MNTEQAQVRADDSPSGKSIPNHVVETWRVGVKHVFRWANCLTAILCWTGSVANCFAQREPAFPSTFINPQRNSSISLQTHWNVRWLWWRPLLRSAAWLTVSAAIQLHIATLYPGTVEITAHFAGRLAEFPRCIAQRKGVWGGPSGKAVLINVAH